MVKWPFNWDYWDRFIDGYYPAKDTPKIQSSFTVPDWDQYFMSIAILASARSKDPTTHHGSVLVDEFNRVVSIGYNSYLAGLDHEKLPNCRVDENYPATKQRNKYRWMRHAEANMLSQAPVDIKPMQNLRVYVSGRPCFPCLDFLIHSGIRHIIMLERNDRWGSKSLEDDPYGDAQDFLWLAKEKNVKLEWLMFHPQDFNWIKEAFQL